MNITGDPTLSVFARGEFFVSQLPRLIEHQTGYLVLTANGTRWEVVDMGDSQIRRTRAVDAGGWQVMNRQAASAESLIDAAAASQNSYVLEIWIVRAGGRFDVPIGGELQGGALIAKLQATENEPFEYRDGQTRFIQQFTQVQDTPAFQSGQSERRSGLIIKGKVREIPGRLELRGTVELSTDESEQKKTEKFSTIAIAPKLGEWVLISALTQADAEARLKPFKMSAGAGVYELRLRVVPGVQWVRENR